MAGWHNGMPGYEIYIDGQPAYQWLPPFGRASSTTACQSGMGLELPPPGGGSAAMAFW